jgi:DNA-binding transcriptional MocR family regulator
MADAISFSRGAPSVDIVDIEGLRTAADRAFTNDPAGTTAYGTAVGYVPLRKLLAAKHGVAPENVIVTNGSMQADAFLFDALVSAGDMVVVELPTYDRTLLSLRNRGSDVRMIELEPDGIDVAALERVLATGARPRLAHIIPNFQNPAGHTLSLAKRERLLELAREYGFVIFEDDPYVELRFSGERLPTMLSMDPERVVYASSFSKTVAPGIRVGYLPLRQWIADKHGVAPENVIVTNGSMQADAFLFDELVHEGAGVVVERPTYDRTLLALRGRGADVRMVELEHDGIDVNGLARLLSDGLRPKLAHIIPNFQNPAGYTLSREKRDGLLDLAREHDFAIFTVAAITGSGPTR